MSQTPATQNLPDLHRAIQLIPSSIHRDIRLKTLPRPKIVHGDDAIVKIEYAGLCGSDLHAYRGNETYTVPIVMGHEFYGEVVELGSSFNIDTTTTSAMGRPPIYQNLKIGDVVTGYFTVTCHECQYCRAGFTSRCIHSQLFGSPNLPGAQAQFIRIPRAGGTLRRVSDFLPSISKSNFDRATLLLLGDIIPTGYFAALQALSHPNVRGRIEGEMPYPISTGIGNPVRNVLDKDHEAAQSTIVTIAVIGLGPVGICAVLSLLSILRNKRPSNFRILAIDPLEQRRHKLERIADTISWLKETSILHCAPPDRAVELLQSLSINETGNLVELFGCDAVVDAVGSNAALRLSYELIRHFGVIASVGVHTAPTLGLNGDELYSKNVSMCFGRCPVGSMFPYALSLFEEFLDILGGIGKEISLIERIVGMDNEADVREAYSKFDSGEWGKLVFRP